MSLRRRELLLGVAATAASRGAAAAPGAPGTPSPISPIVTPAPQEDAPEPSTEYDVETDLRNLKVLDLTEGGRRFVLVVPRYQNKDAPLPLGVFLHGLGETTNERLGAYAWIEKYGLGLAWQRLKRAPIRRMSRRGEWTGARLSEANILLGAQPFRGFAMACPFMPNPSSPAELDDYAKWIETSLIPRCRKEVTLLTTPDKTYLCGVSLGGYVSLEVLTRLPDMFGAWAGVQTAITPTAATGYAEKLSSKRSRPMLLLTSTQDHWRTSSETLAVAFDRLRVKNELRVIPGPHDQLWLREAGSVETLLWLDRLHQPREAGTVFSRR